MQKQKTQISGNITNNIVKQDSNVINADFNGYIDSQTIANVAKEPLKNLKL